MWKTRKVTVPFHPLETILTRRASSRGAGTGTTRGATGRVAASVLALVGILAQGKLLLELAAELTVHGDQLLADGHESLARGNRAVGLDAQLNLRDVRVADWSGAGLALELIAIWVCVCVCCDGKLTLVGCHHDVRCHLKVDAEQIAEGVVFLKHQKIGAVGHAW